MGAGCHLVCPQDHSLGVSGDEKPQPLAPQGNAEGTPHLASQTVTRFQNAPLGHQLCDSSPPFYQGPLEWCDCRNSHWAFFFFK